MEQRLSLPWATGQIALPTVLLDLGNMPPHGAPAPDLTLVVRTPPAEKIATIPLKPAAWVFVVDPTLGPPSRQRLRCIDTEEIQLRIVTLGAQFGMFEPTRRKLLTAIRHVLAAEYSELQQ